MPGGSWQDGWCRGAFEQAEADTTSDPTVLLPRWARGARLRVCGAMLRAQCLCGATLSVWRHAPCVAPCSVCGAMLTAAVYIHRLLTCGAMWRIRLGSALPPPLSRPGASSSESPERAPERRRALPPLGEAHEVDVRPARRAVWSLPAALGRHALHTRRPCAAAARVTFPVHRPSSEPSRRKTRASQRTERWCAPGGPPVSARSERAWSRAMPRARCAMISPRSSGIANAASAAPIVCPLMLPRSSPPRI